MNRLARHITILLLALTLGLHWTVLQSVAWMTMLVDYSAEASFGDAMVKTFDGKHPCKLCLAVANGKRSERNAKQLRSHDKLDWLLTDSTFILVRPGSRAIAVPTTSVPGSFVDPPSPPPPRILHG